MNFQEFSRLYEEVREEFPSQYLVGLHGCFLRQEVKKDSAGPGLVRLGEYIRQPSGLGDHIVLYYGSFIEAYGALAPKKMKEKIFETFAHEVRHHLEHQAGIDPLGDEDRRNLANFRQRMRLNKKDGEKLKLRVVESLALLGAILLVVAILAKIMQ
jgi:hypothetical protein